MKTWLSFLCILTSLSSILAQNVPLYVGTFTTEDSEGIYQYEFNTDTGALTNQTLAVKTSSPTFIAYAPNRKYMYAVNLLKLKIMVRLRL